MTIAEYLLLATCGIKVNYIPYTMAVGMTVIPGSQV